ncbi:MULTISPECIES: M24 family metallopeptidase [Flavobacterium]|uniref:M24 family metallopeptidase n=1 Tax=Flavobacterium TaxID=237 RepID=UPI001FCB8DBF|nr:MULTISPECIES: M24 family metallopeptidase [Flavobacterium]UOK41709.1 aminopeptidase P family protein [Flavobacterium enshiense]
MIKTKLLEAENIAIQLFKTVEEKKLILAGKSEEELNKEIFNLAFEMFGIENHWHKKIVRSGENTLFPYTENPPNKILKDDDILFFDFGPIIENWEADLGRTYVIGNNSEKLKLKNDVEKAWYETKNWFDNQKTLKASELFDFVKQKANEFGWEFGGEIAGHLIGEYPHERLEPGNYQLYVHPENHNDMFSLDANGNERHWILEIHFVDRKNKIGGFFEQLLV